MKHEILANPAAVATFGAELIASELKRPGSSLGLAGGSTPKATYRALAQLDVDWERIPVWLADERWVRATDDQSNQKMALESLGDQVRKSLIPMPWHLEIDASIGAALYEDYLRQRLPQCNGAISPDLVVLGIGDDGHTASLFPGTSALKSQGTYVANWVPKLEAWRVTATTKMLQASRKIIFLVTGEAKAKAIASIWDSESLDPAAVVARGANDVLWILDEAAGSKIRGSYG